MVIYALVYIDQFQLLTDNDRYPAGSLMGHVCNSLDTNCSYLAGIDKQRSPRTLEP